MINIETSLTFFFVRLRLGFAYFNFLILLYVSACPENENVL